MDLFKDVIKSVLQSGIDLSDEEDFNKTYAPFIVNRALSLHYDTVLQANQVNLYPNLPKKLQYQSLLNSIRKYKRPYIPWPKKETLENIEIIKEYYDYSDAKAREIISLLTENDLTKIRKYLNRGGAK